MDKIKSIILHDGRQWKEGVITKTCMEFETQDKYSGQN